MTDMWAVASLWTGLAFVASIISSRLGIATALCEIIVGIIAQYAYGTWSGHSLSAQSPWITFLAGAGAILLTFLAGAELDPDVFRLKWKEATGIGLIGFFVPFMGCGAIAHYLFHWSMPASLLSGVILSATSVAVVYTVMLESGLNKTHYGKTLLAACFINDLVTVLMLGFLFSPFTLKTVLFFVASIALSVASPSLTSKMFSRLGSRPSELETKYLLLSLFGLGAMASWAGSEAVLPAYILGMALARQVGKDQALVRRLRTLTLGLLTPFYFLRAGLMVSVSALVLAPMIVIFFILGQIASKFIGIYPITKLFKSPPKEAFYTTLLMSTGLTFGTIAALFGLDHHIITHAQYSLLVVAVIGTAIIPTLIANTFFLPRHLLEHHLLLEEESLTDQSSAESL